MSSLIDWYWYLGFKLYFLLFVGKTVQGIPVDSAGPSIKTEEASKAFDTPSTVPGKIDFMNIHTDVDVYYNIFCREEKCNNNSGRKWPINSYSQVSQDNFKYI